MKKYRLLRDIANDECPWLFYSGVSLTKGMMVYEFPDVYGCALDGITVSLRKSQYPYFEIPRESLVEVIGIEFSLN